MPTGDFTFGYRVSDTDAYTELENRMNDEEFIINFTTANTATSNVTFRVPSTHQLTSIRNGVLGSYGTNEIADWASATAGGFTTYTRLFNGGLNISYAITGGTV